MQIYEIPEAMSRVSEIFFAHFSTRMLRARLPFPVLSSGMTFSFKCRTHFSDADDTDDADKSRKKSALSASSVAEK